MDKKNEKRKVKGNIYAYINKKGFVNLVLDIDSIGELEAKLCDYNQEAQRKTNKKLLWKIYLTNK